MAILDLSTHYAVFVLAPPVLADRLRRRACARDFECPCHTDPATDRPICFDLKPNCRFAEASIAPTAGELEAFTRQSPRTKLTIALNIKAVLAYMAATGAEREKMIAVMRRAKARFLGRCAQGRRDRNSLPDAPQPS